LLLHSEQWLRTGGQRGRYCRRVHRANAADVVGEPRRGMPVADTYTFLVQL
jgi:hypothetical protein